MKLKKGATIIHCKDNTLCTIEENNGKNLKVNLSASIDAKTKLTLPITHMGQYLFLKLEEVEESIEIFYLDDNYYRCGNKEIS